MKHLVYTTGLFAERTCRCTNEWIHIIIDVSRREEIEWVVGKGSGFMALVGGMRDILGGKDSNSEEDWQTGSARYF